MGVGWGKASEDRETTEKGGSCGSGSDRRRNLVRRRFIGRGVDGELLGNVAELADVALPRVLAEAFDRRGRGVQTFTELFAMNGQEVVQQEREVVQALA